MYLLYLDSCSIQRPLDDQTQIRVAAEAEAVMTILSLWENAFLKILGSEILDFEASRIPDKDRRNYMIELLGQLSPFIQLNDTIEERAEALSTLNVKPLDALHLASAEYGKADFLCTTDDKFLKRAKASDTSLQVVSPLELITLLEL